MILELVLKDGRQFLVQSLEITFEKRTLCEWKIRIQKSVCGPICLGLGFIMWFHLTL